MQNIISSTILQRLGRKKCLSSKLCCSDSFFSTSSSISNPFVSLHLSSQALFCFVLLFYQIYPKFKILGCLWKMFSGFRKISEPRLVCTGNFFFSTTSKIDSRFFLSLGEILNLDLKTFFLIYVHQRNTWQQQQQQQR